MVNVMAKLPGGSRFRAARIDARRRIAARAGALFGAFAVGAIAEYFLFDGRNATRRRHMARERSMAIVRRRRRAAVRRAKYLEGVAEGVAHRAAHAVPGRNGQREALDDVSLARKVESVAFRDAGVSKAHVSVNAEKGVVYLRGRLETEREIEDLVRATAAVEGVARVENMLHTPRFQAAG
jgi:osmotically-inducible protein OsmY